MRNLPILFCHGLESGPFGSKYRALVAAGHKVHAPDMVGMNLSERVTCTANLYDLYGPHLTVGSSYGGLTAVLAAALAKVTLPGLVLCAPALERLEAPNILNGRALELPLVTASAKDTVLIHGTQDDVIPIEVSCRYSSRTGARLIQLEDNHRLKLDSSLETLLKVVSDLRS